MLPAGLAVAVVAVAVAALLEDNRATAPSPSEIHWHATYEYIVGGEVQPPAPRWEGSGVHTHGDGIIHIHPFTQSEEGAGARLVKWFEYCGGLLDGNEVRLPGSPVTYANGDECADGTIGVVQVFVNGERLRDYQRYIPRDGGRIAIVFGPERDFVQKAVDERAGEAILIAPDARD